MKFHLCLHLKDINLPLLESLKLESRHGKNQNFKVNDQSLFQSTMLPLRIPYRVFTLLKLLTIYREIGIALNSKRGLSAVWRRRLARGDTTLTSALIQPYVSTSRAFMVAV